MVDKTTNNKLQILRLYRSDYLTQYHVREIATLLKKSHVTLLPHLHALEKDKILTAKTNGRNKEYSLNFDNVVTKNYLLLAETFESLLYLEDIFLIKKVTSEILNIPLDGTIILFGSYAKKTYNKRSDIDLFYIGTITDKDIQAIKKIGEIYGKTINIKRSTLKNFELGLRRKDPLIVEVIKHHILLQQPERFINALWRYSHEIK
jgi:predicted nucleotidyltransferase